MKAMLGKARWCAICGLRIPETIVSPEHPLFGTVDHVVPKSKGGTNAVANRRPAHRWCNGFKADRLSINNGMIGVAHAHIGGLLARLGSKPPTKTELKQARIAVPINLPTKGYVPPIDRHLFSFQRWEDDGGPSVSA